MRVLQQLLLDKTLHLRNGFYAAVAFVAILYAVIFRLLPTQDIKPWLALLIMSNLLVTSYYFLAGLMLLDKASGSLQAIAVTPIRDGEFIVARLLALAILATAENILVVSFGLGWQYAHVSSWPVILMMAYMFGLFGYINVLRYDSISTFLMPSMLYLCFYLAVFLAWFDIVPNWLIWLHPFGPALKLLASSLNGEWSLSSVYALGLCAVWIIGSSKFAANQHVKFVTQRAG